MNDGVAVAMLGNYGEVESRWELRKISFGANVEAGSGVAAIDYNNKIRRSITRNSTLTY